jgi:hypothetical protein
MSALESRLEQALQLIDAKRGKLAMRLLRTLEPDDEDEVTGSSGRPRGRPKSIAV